MPSGQLELTIFTPSTILPSVRPGEWIIRPGKPILLGQEISIKEASRILGLSERRIIEMCDQGKLVEGRDWNQPNGPRGKYFLNKTSILAMKGLLPEP